MTTSAMRNLNPKKVEAVTNIIGKETNITEKENKIVARWRKYLKQFFEGDDITLNNQQEE